MVRGGKRIGSGRPRGSNAYGESTTPIRVPVSRVEEIKALIATESYYQIPFYSSSVRAGAPTLADDHIDQLVNLNEFLVHNPKSTFLVTASGDSMINAGIHHGDILVVDKSIHAVSENIVIASIDGDLTVKRLQISAGVIQLKAENPVFATITILNDTHFQIIGVVTHVIHKTL